MGQILTPRPLHFACFGKQRGEQATVLPCRLRAAINCDFTLARRILGGAEQPPVPAENSIEFGAAISAFRFPIRRLSRATHWRIQWKFCAVNLRGEFGAVISDSDSDAGCSARSIYI